MAILSGKLGSAGQKKKKKVWGADSRGIGAGDFETHGSSRHGGEKTRQAKTCQKRGRTLLTKAGVCSTSSSTSSL